MSDAAGGDKFASDALTIHRPGALIAMLRRPAAIAVLVLLGSGAGTAGAAPPQEKQDREGLDFFEKKIRPILVERCYSCHSAEAEKLKAHLLLDSRQGLLKGGDRGPAVVPGDPDRSLLVQALRQIDEDIKMPPKGK